MNYQELLKSNANVSVTVNLQDLHAFFQQVSGDTRKLNEEEENSQEFLSRKQTLKILGIDSSTLWNWEKTGYIVSYPFGGRKRYRSADIELIRTGKKGK